MVSIVIGAAGIYLSCVGLFMKTEDKPTILPHVIRNRNQVQALGIVLCCVAVLVQRIGL